MAADGDGGKGGGDGVSGGLNQIRIRVEQVLSKFSVELKKILGVILRPQIPLSYPSKKNSAK